MAKVARQESRDGHRGAPLDLEREAAENGYVRGSAGPRARVGMDRRPKAKPRRPALDSAFHTQASEESMVEDQSRQSRGTHRRRKDARARPSGSRTSEKG